MPGITRRAFLATGGLLAGLAATGALGNALEAGRSFLRPPGAVGETAFLARCTRCQACLSACPERIIQPLSIADSIKGAGTPTLDFSRAYCTFCKNETGTSPRCAAACPSGALTPSSGQARINGVASVNTTSCIAWDWKGCTACVDECPQGAIGLDEKKRPVVDEKACDGCGLCELICPSASLRSYGGAGEGKGIAVVPLEGSAQ